jgi:hypothetical protein
MVKNYLVGAVRKITDGWHIENSPNLHEMYMEMYRLRLASYKKFVQEDFEPILWTDEVKNNEDYTIANWEETKKLRDSGPCNIFWAGSDTLMVKPTNLFSIFKEFRMFNWTDPKTHPSFPHYYNDDIIYYPHTTSEKTWKIGDVLWKYCKNDPERNWGFDQRRHNTMFWTQDIPDSDRRHPELAFQCMWLKDFNDVNAVNWHNNWNEFDIKDAHILHFHGSRGSQDVIAAMKNACKQLGIEV